jgi:hypothetical protein
LVALARPVTVNGEAEPVAVAPPGEAVTVYDVMASPLVAGATKEMTAEALPGAPVGAAGATGTPAGVTAAVEAEATEVPPMVVAFTVNVYAVPLVRPVTTSGEEAPVAVAPPGDAVTVYDVTLEPLLLTGGRNETLADWFPRTADGVVGAVGAPAGVTVADAFDNVDSPMALVVFRRNVYGKPLVRPLTTMGDVVPLTAGSVVPFWSGTTVYSVMGEPLLAAAGKATDTEVSPNVPTGAAGVSGRPAGVTAAEAGDASDEPELFVAVTVKVYAVPFVRPVTVVEVPKPGAVPVAPPGEAVTV